jgi:predicted HicB family RNase H-like nuclease
MSEFQPHSQTPQSGIATPPQSPPTAAPRFGQSSPGTDGHATAQPITKRQEVCRVAAELFRQTPDWVSFFREVLGVEGVAHRIFSNPEEMKAFERTAEYAEIQGMVAKLRAKSRYQTESNEPTRVITVRLPKSLHESLKAESHQRQTSMNQLCISKLLQIIDNDLVPSD